MYGCDFGESVLSFHLEYRVELRLLCLHGMNLLAVHLADLRLDFCMERHWRYAGCLRNECRGTVWKWLG